MKPKSLFLLCVFLFAGCGVRIPMSNTKVVPVGIAATAEELTKLLMELEMGAPKEQVFEQLKLTPDTPNIRFITSAKEKQELLYGNVIVQGTPADMRRFKQELDRREIIEIVYQHPERWMDINPILFRADFHTTGPSFVSYIIFEDGRLAEVRKPDRTVLEHQERRYIIDLIPGAAQGAAGAAGRMVRP